MKIPVVVPLSRCLPLLRGSKRCVGRTALYVREKQDHFYDYVVTFITEQTLLKKKRHFYGPLRALAARASTGGRLRPIRRERLEAAQARR